MEGGTLSDAKVRLKFEAKPGDKPVRYGREIPVKMTPSFKQKIKVFKVVVSGLTIHRWPLN